MANKIINLIFLFVISSTVTADQTNSRLDDMFIQLKSAENIEDAYSIAGGIWAVWSESNNQNINKLMEEGKIAIARFDLDTALAIFDQIIEVKPKFAEGWNKRATVNYMAGNYIASLADIEKTLKLEPRHFGALAGRGLCYLELEYWQEALDSFEAALNINPWLQGAQQRVEELKHRLNYRSI